MKKIDIKQLQSSAKKLPWKIANNLFVSFVVLIVLALLIGALIFFRFYVYSPQEEGESATPTFRFRSQIYQQVLDVWQEREKSLQETNSKQYPSLFSL